MNKEDLRVYRAWHYCESVLGPTLTNELRLGRSIYIAAKNGKVYELGPHGHVGCVTTNVFYCIHMATQDGIFVDSDYPYPDLIVHRYDWIIHDPDKFEEEAGIEFWTLNSLRGRNMMLDNSNLSSPRGVDRNLVNWSRENDENDAYLDAMICSADMGETIGRALAGIL